MSEQCKQEGGRLYRVAGILLGARRLLLILLLFMVYRHSRSTRGAGGGSAWGGHEDLIATGTAALGFGVACKLHLKRKQLSSHQPIREEKITL